ncbi:MAG: hypothetical protein WA970_01630, partial [Gammaproteobacteria bacterium]
MKNYCYGPISPYTQETLGASKGCAVATSAQGVRAVLLQHSRKGPWRDKKWTISDSSAAAPAADLNRKKERREYLGAEERHG